MRGFQRAVSAAVLPELWAWSCGAARRISSFNLCFANDAIALIVLGVVYRTSVFNLQSRMGCRQDQVGRAVMCQGIPRACIPAMDRPGLPANRQNKG